MKITPEHFQHIQSNINNLLENNPQLINDYETGNFPRSEQVKDLQTRFCFDLSHMSGLTRWICDNIYPYAHDDHLATALKKACPKVTRKY